MSYFLPLMTGLADPNRRLKGVAALALGAIFLIAFLAAREITKRQDLERTFITIAPVPDALVLAVSRSSRDIDQRLSTHLSSDQIFRFYDEELLARGWQTNTTARTAIGTEILSCYGDPTGRLTAKVATGADTSRYEFVLSRDGCDPRLQQ